MQLPSELTRQLNILGYTAPTSRVRIRCFAAKGMPLDEQLKCGIAWQKDGKTVIPSPVEGWLYPNGVFVRLKKKRYGDAVELDSNNNPVWREAKTYQNGVGYLQSLNARGYGIYLIPNEGGGADGDINRFPSLFYEHDGIGKHEQWQKLRSLESKLGRSASMVVETRNSLHCYFALSYNDLLSSTWTQYQQRLIQEQQSDEAIWNPARLMRLVGFDHQRWNQETRSLEQFPVRLAWESDSTFSLDEFEQVLPQWDEERWQPRQQPSKRVATEPIDNPLDIRNFAHYLDGYRADGRRGWDTCKCPAHNGESDNSLHVEQSSGAFKCHAGCQPKDVYHSALELAKSRGYQVAEPRAGHRFSDLGHWLFKIKNQLAKTVERRKAWGFGDQVEVEQENSAVSPAIEYQAGEQLEAWSGAVNNGARNILVSDATGCGKSHFAGMATAELFKATQIIYISNEHRNASTATLASWVDLEGRHQGLRQDDFGRKRRAENGQPYTTAPNCARNQVVNALRTKNVRGADTAGLICETCPFLEPCRGGQMFGYLHQRSNALKQPRLRAHPSSLPEPREYDYSNKVLLWDEASVILKPYRSISIAAADLQQAIADLALKLPSVFDSLRPLLTTLHQYLSGEIKQPNKFGWKHNQLLAALPKPNSLDVEAISVALAPDVNSLLNTTAQYGVDLAELPAGMRKRFSDSDGDVAARIEKELALAWLPEFLDVLLSNTNGHLRIEHGRLILTLPDRRLAEIAQAAKANLFLDATFHAEDLARVLGVEPASIVTMRQTIPKQNNLEIIQIATLGQLGIGSRRKDKDGENTLLQERIDALISQIRQDNPGVTAIVDFKRHAQAGVRHWWVDSRGINDLENCGTLVLIGKPCRNLNELEAEFYILFGRSPQEGTERVKYQIKTQHQLPNGVQPYFEMDASIDPDFRNFVRRRILGDIHQAIGRLRAHRRPNKRLKVYFLGDYALDIAVTLKRASDITLEAATKTERVEMAIKGAVQQLKSTGGKVTQQAIADLTGYSQQYISRFRVLLQTLLEPLNSKSSKNGEPPPPTYESPPEPSQIDWMSSQYVPLLAESPLHELLNGVLGSFEAYGTAAWRQIWDAAPAAAQLKILQALMFTLSAGELRALAAAMEVST